MLKLPPPIWGAIFVLLALLVSWFLGWREVSSLAFPLLGILLIIVGALIPVWALWIFRCAGTEVNPTSPANRKLIVEGPYRFTRNPMYLGLVLATLGIAFWIGPWPMFVAPVALFATANFVHIPYEEVKMGRQFGAAYANYVRHIHRWV